MDCSIVKPSSLSPVGSWAAWVGLLLVIPAICFLAANIDSAVYLSFILLIASLSVFLRNARRYFGHFLTPVGIFAMAAALHAAIGYALAGPTSGAIWISSAGRQFYPQAFLVVSSGLCAAAIGYKCMLDRKASDLTGLSTRFLFSDAKLIIAARFFVVTGAVLMAGIYLRLGFVPILSASAGELRYFTADMSTSYREYEWFMARALELLTYSLPVVLCAAAWRGKPSDWIVGGIGLVAAALPLRRANLIALVFVVVVMQILKDGSLRLRYIAALVTLLLVYVGSQAIFFGLLADKYIDSEAAVGALGSALPEVRDLGWTMSLLHGSWNGVTFIQALIPVPSLISDFSQKSSVRALTTSLIGLDQDQHSGGLRLTVPGESYLNFGWLGVMVIGSLFGVACSYLDRIAATFQPRRQLASYYVIALLFGWLCFWLYLGGTQAAATIKIGLVEMCAMLYFSRISAEGGTTQMRNKLLTSQA